MSDANNFHEEKLEGTWVCDEKEKDGKQITETLDVSDLGSKYIAKSLNDKKIMTFILTRLDSFYFISMETKKEGLYIFRIQFMDNKLLVLGLNEEGLRLYEKIHETRGKRIYIKISQSELQQWCVRNANLFTYNVKCYERKNDNRNDSVTNTESVTMFATEFCTVIRNDIVEGSPKNNLSRDDIKEYGEKVKIASYKMLSIISKETIPNDVRDASLDIAKNYDKMANILINSPYILRDISGGYLSDC